MERLTNEETTSELKKDMRRMLKKGFEVAPIALRYIALSKYEDTGLTPDEIKCLQKENADLQSQLSKAVKLLELAMARKKCKNCGKYFIPQNRSDTLYCDRKAPQDEAKTCKEYGARQAWKTTLKENEAAGLYRKIYMSKQMLRKRNPDVKEYAESFEKYKEQAKKWKADVKNGIKSEADYLEWLKAVKEKKIL